MQNSTDLTDVLRAAMLSLQSSMNVSLPATVKDYDPVNGSVTVEIQILQWMTDDSTQAIPLISNVPVCFPSTHRSLISMPLEEGDTGLLVFSQRSLDKWLAVEEVNAPPVNPLDRRKNDIQDGIFYPGLFPYSLSPTDPSKHNLTHDANDVIIKHNLGESSECEVRLKQSDGEVQVNSPVKVLVDAPDAQFTGNVQIDQNLDVTGDTGLSSTVTSNGKDISDTHSHIGSATAAPGPVSPTGVPN